MIFPQRGDRITCQDYPLDYPLMVLAVVGGRVAIGSPLWPRGANHPVELHQITSINDQPVHFVHKSSINTRKNRRKAA
jgi:hypothetical protein